MAHPCTSYLLPKPLPLHKPSLSLPYSSAQITKAPTRSRPPHDQTTRLSFFLFSLFLSFSHTGTDTPQQTPVKCPRYFYFVEILTLEKG